MSEGAKPLKAQNLRWLCAIALLDMAILGVGSFTAAPMADLAAAQPYWAAVLLPPVILLLSSLVPSETKAKLVFWRRQDALPGHRAFTHFATRDPRVDLARLKATLGDLPTAPGDQNRTWYRMYLEVRSDPAVAESQKLFLLFRDAAAMSLLLSLALVPMWWIASFSTLTRTGTAVFLAQYLLCVVAARNNGHRFVGNVLATHSQQRV